MPFPVDRRSLRDAWYAFATTRLLIPLAAIVAAQASDMHVLYDDPRLTAPYGELGDALLSPLARFDSVWYLSIAHDGYHEARGGRVWGESWAFFPLYPLLVRALAPVNSPEVLLVTAVTVSLACFLAALYLLHRLAALELGDRMARSTVLLLACFPGSLYFGVPMSESLFLLLSVGAFLCARTGRWGPAAGLAAAASATRSTGALLVVPLALLYLYGPRADRPDPPPEGEARPAWRPRHPLRRDALWLLLAPVGVAVWSGYLALDLGDALRWAHAQETEFDHRFYGPLGGVALGLSDAASALGEGPGWESVFVVLRAATAVGAIAAGVALFMRLPVAYGAWVACAVAVPLSTPAPERPLASIARYVAVLFPVFMLLAMVCDRRRILAPVLALFTGLLVVVTVRYALTVSFGL